MTGPGGAAAPASAWLSPWRWVRRQLRALALSHSWVTECRVRAAVCGSEWWKFNWVPPGPGGRALWVGHGGPAGYSESLAASGCSNSVASVNDCNHLKFELGGLPTGRPGLTAGQGSSSEPASPPAAGTVTPGRAPGPEAVTLLPVLSSGYCRAAVTELLPGWVTELEPGLSHSPLQLVAAQQPVMRQEQGSTVTVSRTKTLCRGHWVSDQADSYSWVAGPDKRPLRFDIGGPG